MTAELGDDKKVCKERREKKERELLSTYLFPHPYYPMIYLY